jgi:photosystem II stability/assembly factor-like uncharacterized protein
VHGSCFFVPKGRFIVLRSFGLWRWLLAGLVAVGWSLADAAQTPPDDPRQRQIEEIRRQLDELSRKLDALSQSEAPTPSESPATTPLPDGWLKNLKWRSIGPANMGGRITALAVYEADPTIFYVATASGGLLKTTNNGLTFQHQFDTQPTVSIGDVAVAATDPNLVWVGTGEANPRNSVSYGDGVYKSTDGGKSWTHMGLSESFQIGRIVIHPTDPNIVYVGALGRLWGPNNERGLYKTTDGGKTWTRILFVDDRTGVIDIAMHPNDPDTLLVATWERARDLYDTNEPSVQFGPGAAIHKTTDGGQTWTRLSKGLPTSKLGRVGLCYYRKDPRIVYAIVESETIGTGPPNAAASAYAGIQGETENDRVVLRNVVPDGPAAQAGLQPGDILLERDGSPIKSYEALVESLADKKPGDSLRLKIQRGDQTQELTLTLGQRPASSRGRGPRDPNRPFRDFLGGQRENIQNRQGENGFDYGGVYRSEDGGESWTRVNSLNPRPMYFSQIRVDPNDDQRVYVLGISLHRSADGGKSFRGDGGRNVHADHHALWINPRDSRHMLLGCDGGIYATYDRMQSWDHLNQVAIGQFYDVAVDSRRDYWVYGGLQDNGTWGGPSRLLAPAGPLNEDWRSIGGGDGFQVQVDPTDPDLVYFTSQNGGIGRRNVRTGQVRYFQPQPPAGESYRWNWNTPFVLSPTNPKIYTVAANRVFRSFDRGNGLRVISPNLTRTDRGSATALAESPRNPNVLYVGTDDGALWVTRDGGAQWTNLTDRVGLPRPMHVATIEASRFADGRVYVAFDGHRSDLDGPFAYASEDYGQTWRSLNAGLPPRGSTRCLREDIVNPNLLFLGTEFAAFVSIDAGRSWSSLNTNLPTVAVHDFAIHPDPNVGEVVAATHGRSLWILDATPIRQATPAILAAPAHLYQPTRSTRWLVGLDRGKTNRRFTGENPPRGVPLYYHLHQKAQDVSLKILDAAGVEVRSIPAVTQPGLHRATWDLGRIGRRPPSNQTPAEPSPPPVPVGEGTGSEPTTSAESPSRPSSQPRTGALSTLMNLRPRLAAAGTYRVVLNVDGKEYTQTLALDPDPAQPDLDSEQEFLLTEEAEEEDEEFLWDD